MTSTSPSDRSSAASSDRSALEPSDRSSGPLPAVGPPPVRWPLWIALALIGGVFAAGAWWSFREQTALAQFAGFHQPELLPLTIDGFAVAMAALAWAASLDGRAAVFARTGVAVGILFSAAANATWAWLRSDANLVTVVIASVVPIIAMVAFEVLLGEARKQVQRRRGLPAPEAIPLPRLVRVALAPCSTLWQWRKLVLARTDPARQFEALDAAARTGPWTDPQTGQKGGRRTGRMRSGKRSTDQAPDRSGEAATGTSDRSVDWSGEVATVTSIRSMDRKRTGPQTGPRTASRTGRGDPDRDALAVLDRFPDGVPARNVVARAMGWGSSRAANAIDPDRLKAAQRRRAEQPTGRDEPERSTWTG